MLEHKADVGLGNVDTEVTHLRAVMNTRDLRRDLTKLGARESEIHRGSVAVEHDHTCTIGLGKRREVLFGGVNELVFDDDEHPRARLVVKDLCE